MITQIISSKIGNGRKMLDHLEWNSPDFTYENLIETWYPEIRGSNIILNKIDIENMFEYILNSNKKK